MRTRKRTSISTKRASLWKDICRHPQIYLLMLPGMLFIFVFSYLPMGGYLLAFENYNIQQGILGSPFVGLENFRFFFSGKDWLLVTRNTLILNGLFIIFGMGLAVLLALIINEMKHRRLRKIVQSTIFLPYFISWLVIDRIRQQHEPGPDGVPVPGGRSSLYGKAGRLRAVFRGTARKRRCKHPAETGRHGGGRAVEAYGSLWKKPGPLRRLPGPVRQGNRPCARK